MKGIHVYILRDSLGDCTANGASSKVDKMILVDESISGPFEVEEDEVYLIVVRRKLFGGEYLHLEPRKNNKSIRPGGYVGAMMGGNFAHTSDSRFREVANYPLPIHDRFETQAFCNSMD
jgi:hypothetical protein